MAQQIPEGLVLKRNRDLEGKRHEAWIRRSLIALVAVVPVLALFNVFGQRPHVETARAGPASLELYSTPHLRGGLIWEARFTVFAHRELRKATLELDRGWMEGFTINTVEPAPIGEGSHDGNLVLELGQIPAGDKYALYIQLQANPTTVGRRDQDVRLFDGEQLIATIHRRATVYP